MKTAELVRQAQDGDEGAFTHLVKNHQNFVLGYAFNRLGDFHRAQDVVQETVMIAHAKLGSLHDPEAFSGWLRGIALNCCRRSIRMTRGDWVSLDHHLELEAEGDDPLVQVERFEETDLVHQAIAKLPPGLRDVTTLYYLEERSQKDVAAFLGVSIAKVNNDLHASRQHMEGSLSIMAKQEIGKERLNDAFAEQLGEVVRVEGPFVEAQMKEGEMPGHLDVLGTGDEGSEVVVIQRLGEGKYRALQTGEAPSAGDALTRRGNTYTASHKISEDMIRDVVERQKGKQTQRLLETGIKVVDLMAPLVDGSTLGIIGGAGVGRAVFLEELIERRNQIEGDLKTFFFLDGWDAMGAQGMVYERDHASDIHSNLENTFLLYNRGKDPLYARDADYLDARLYFSPIAAMKGHWPSIDPLHCYSVSATAKVLEPRHIDLVAKVRETLQGARDILCDVRFYELVALGARQEAMRYYKTRREDCLKTLSEEDRVGVHRAERLEAFFTQPFLTTEEFTGKNGEVVTLAQTLDGVEAILGGKFDDVKVADLILRGAI